MDNTRGIMRRFCIALNNIYRTYYKISARGSEIWLLYMLDDGRSYSQKQLCDEWDFPRTTLNAIIKNAEAEGYLMLVPIPGKRREMAIRLTESGAERAKELLAPIYRAEDEALQKVFAQGGRDFVEALEYFNQCLKEAFGRSDLVDN